MKLKEANETMMAEEDESESTKKNVYKGRKRKKKKKVRHGGYGGKQARKGYEDMLEAADEY